MGSYEARIRQIAEAQAVLPALLAQLEGRKRGLELEKTTVDAQIPLQNAQITSDSASIALARASADASNGMLSQFGQLREVISAILPQVVIEIRELILSRSRSALLLIADIDQQIQTVERDPANPANQARLRALRFARQVYVDVAEIRDEARLQTLTSLLDHPEAADFETNIQLMPFNLQVAVRAASRWTAGTRTGESMLNEIAQQIQALRSTALANIDRLNSNLQTLRSAVQTATDRSTELANAISSVTNELEYQRRHGEEDRQESARTAEALNRSGPYLHCCDNRPFCLGLPGWNEQDEAHYRGYEAHVDARPDRHGACRAGGS